LRVGKIEITDFAREKLLLARLRPTV